MKRLKDFINKNEDSMKYLKKFESWEESGEAQESGEEHDAYYDDEPSTADEVAQKWEELLDDSFFFDFIKAYPSKGEFEERLNNYNMSDEDKDIYGDNTEVCMLETEFRSFPGEDVWNDFYNELVNVNW